MVLGFGMGLMWGEAFRKTDQAIKYETQWFGRMSPFWKWFIAAILDTQHHWQYGVALILFAVKVDVAVPLLMAWMSENPYGFFSWVASSLLGLFKFFSFNTPNLFLQWFGWGFVASDWKDYQYVLKRMGLLMKEGQPNAV